MTKNSENNNKYCPRTLIERNRPSGFAAGEWRRDDGFGGLQPIARMVQITIQRMQLRSDKAIKIISIIKEP